MILFSIYIALCSCILIYFVQILLCTLTLMYVILPYFIQSILIYLDCFRFDFVCIFINVICVCSLTYMHIPRHQAAYNNPPHYGISINDDTWCESLLPVFSDTLWSKPIFKYRCMSTEMLLALQTDIN